MPYKFSCAFIFLFVFCVTISHAMEEEDRQRKLAYLDLETEKSFGKEAKRKLNGEKEVQLTGNEQQEYYTDRAHDESYRHRKSRVRNHFEKLDANIVEKMIADSPSRLQTFVKMLKRRQQLGKPLFGKDDHDSHTITLVGPPGVGKTYLALAISQYCEFPYEFIQVTKLGNQYIRSAQTELDEKFEALLRLNAPYILIFDELHKIVQHEGGQKNEDVAFALSQSLDSIRGSNVLFIGTANELDELPEQLRQRLSAKCYTVHLPDYNSRREIIGFKISGMPLVSFSLDSNDKDGLAKETAGFAPRDFDKMFEEARSIVCDKAIQENEEAVLEEKVLLEITKEDLLKAIVLVKEQKPAFRPWYIKGYESVKSNIIPICAIGVPLIVTCYIYYKGSQAQKDGYYQAERFHREQLETNRMNTLFDAGAGIGNAITYLDPMIGVPITIGSYAAKAMYTHWKIILQTLDQDKNN